MHVHAFQIIKHIGDIAQFWPVVLDVLAGCEVAIALVVFFRQMGEHLHLCTVQRAVGNGHAQHIGVQLQIDTVHQAQGFEFILAQMTRDAPLDLRAELGVARGEKTFVKFGIGIHQMRSCLPCR